MRWKMKIIRKLILKKLLLRKFNTSLRDMLQYATNNVEYYKSYNPNCLSSFPV